MAQNRQKLGLGAIRNPIFLRHVDRRFRAINNDLIAMQTELTSANEALEARVAERTVALRMADHRKDEPYRSWMKGAVVFAQPRAAANA